jgi:hypothetical protein
MAAASSSAVMADLADHHAGGQIGQMGGIQRIQAGGTPRGDRRDDGIAGAGDIEYLPCDGRNAPDAVRIHERDAELAQCQQQLLEIKVRAQLGRGRQHSVQPVSVDAGGERQLASIWRDQRRAPIAFEGLSLGVHQHREPTRSGRCDQPRAQCAGKHTFAIVRQKQGVHGVEHGVHRAEQAIRKGRLNGLGALGIDA